MLLIFIPSDADAFRHAAAYAAAAADAYATFRCYNAEGTPEMPVTTL